MWQICCNIQWYLQICIIFHFNENKMWITKFELQRFLIVLYLLPTLVNLHEQNNLINRPLLFNSKLTKPWPWKIIKKKEQLKHKYQLDTKKTAPKIMAPFYPSKSFIAIPFDTNLVYLHTWTLLERRAQAAEYFLDWFDRCMIVLLSKFHNFISDGSGTFFVM